jgi:hypothetical protein
MILINGDNFVLMAAFSAGIAVDEILRMPIERLST